MGNESRMCKTTIMAKMEENGRKSASLVYKARRNSRSLSSSLCIGVWPVWETMV